MTVSVPHVVLAVGEHHLGWIAAGNRSVVFVVIEALQVGVLEQRIELVVLRTRRTVGGIVSFFVLAHFTVRLLLGKNVGETALFLRRTARAVQYG